MALLQFSDVSNIDQYVGHPTCENDGSPSRHRQLSVTESPAGVHHMPEAYSQGANPTLSSIAPSSSAKEFVEFWLQNSVHADEQMTGRRGREAILKLADRLVVTEGFSNQQIEEEIGGIYTYIRTSIDAEKTPPA